MTVKTRPWAALGRNVLPDPAEQYNFNMTHASHPRERGVQPYSLCEGRAPYFLMTVSVPLGMLDFPHARPLDTGHISRLRTQFRVRCNPSLEEHRIPAVVDEDDLREVQFTTGKAHGFAIYQPPTGTKLHCLHGQHRVKAAETLARPVTTWVVDLYSKGACISVLVPMRD